MEFTKSLVKGKLIKRYKRFFTDVKLDKEVVTAHCPNTGSMKGLLDQGNEVFLSKNDDAGGASCCSFAIAGLAPCCLSDLRKINEPSEIFTKYLSEPGGVFIPGFLAGLIGAVSAMPASVPWNLQSGASS